MRGRSAVLTALTAATLGVAAAPAAAETVHGVTSGVAPRLVTFDSATPGTFTGDVALTGIPADRTVVGIDTRPATLQVVLLDSAGQLYVVDTTTGAATPVGTGTGIAGATGVDVNPTVDRVRVVGAAGQGGGAGLGNARVNPNTGAAVQADGDLAFAAGDVNQGKTPEVAATAYTNAFPASQTFPDPPSTSQFDLEAGSDVLVQQVPPNDGTLRTIGPLGTDLQGPAGFDVVTDDDGRTNRAYAAFGGKDAVAPAFYSVNLTSGRATKIGDFPGVRAVIDIAVAPVVPRLALLTSDGLGRQALSAFPADRPQAAGQGAVPVSGLPAGTRLLGIDRRPANGALYGLGSDSRLYTVDAGTGAATPVGAEPFTPALSGTDFGFDFNPMVDRIRVVSDTGQNLRLNPDTGGGAVAPPSAADPNLNGATATVTGAAYTNAVSPAPGATTLFDVDTAGGTLVRQDPANAGTTVVVGPLAPMGSGVGALDGANGYDISPRFDHGFLAAGGELLSVNAVASPAMGTPPVTAANGSAAPIGSLGLGTLTRVDGLAVLDPGQVSGPGTVPRPVTSPRIRTRVTASVTPRRDRRAPFRYTLRGRVVPRTTAAAGAFVRGIVVVTARRAGARRVLGQRVVRLSRTGRYRVRVTVPKRTLRGSGRKALRLQARFNGTTTLAGSRTTKRVRAR